MLPSGGLMGSPIPQTGSIWVFRCVSDSGLGFPFIKQRAQRSFVYISPRSLFVHCVLSIVPLEQRGKGLIRDTHQTAHHRSPHLRLYYFHHLAFSFLVSEASYFVTGQHNPFLWASIPPFSHKVIVSTVHSWGQGHLAGLQASTASREYDFTGDSFITGLGSSLSSYSGVY